MRAIIVASGQPPNDQDWQRWVHPEDLIIGANGGAARLLSRGLIPHVVVGDMDSLAARGRELLAARRSRFVEHPRAKDETDLELALTYAVDQGAREIVVLGAMGGRLDHTLSNVLLLTLPGLRGKTVRIVQGGEEVLLLHGGESVSLAGNPGDLVSLLPLGGDARGVTTAGLAWQLEDDTLRFGFSRGVSNEMVASQACVALADGQLLIVHSPPPQDEGLEAVGVTPCGAGTSPAPTPNDQ